MFYIYLCLTEASVRRLETMVLFLFLSDNINIINHPRCYGNVFI